jgi:hypothetical protein
MKKISEMNTEELRGAVKALVSMLERVQDEVRDDRPDFWRDVQQCITQYGGVE